MKLTKEQRSALRGMFDGRCAYCGCELPERWHADHFEPILRNSFRANVGPAKPENDTLNNLFPACPACNISKGPMALEEWRGWLAGHVASLNKYNTPYRLAKAFGLLEETGLAVVFHFERANGEPRSSVVPGVGK